MAVLMSGLRGSPSFYGFFSRPFSYSVILSRVMPSACCARCFALLHVRGGIGEQQGLRLWLFVWDEVNVLQLCLRQSEGSGGDGPWCGLTLSAQEKFNSHGSTATQRQHLMLNWFHRVSGRGS